MTNISIENLISKLLLKKTLLDKELVVPHAHINKCEIHDVIDAAEALSTREKEHRLYDMKKQQVQQIDSVIDKLNQKQNVECDSCGISIVNRLEIVPTAKHCIKCQTQIEKTKPY